MAIASVFVARLYAVRDYSPDCTWDVTAFTSWEQAAEWLIEQGAGYDHVWGYDGQDFDGLMIETPAVHRRGMGDLCCSLTEVPVAMARVLYVGPPAQGREH